MKTVLLVDDNEDLRYSVIEGLKPVIKGIEFVEAESGRKALAILDRKEVDAVLLDIMMPIMDGWQVAAKIKENPNLKKIPIIFLTAKIDDLSKGLGRITAEDYIEKPFEVNDLKKRLEKVLWR